MTSERISTGYAALKTDSDDIPVQVSGVAIGEGDITRGDSGKKTLWPKETLQDAPLRGSKVALEGQPIATDDNHTSEEAKSQTPTDAVRGELTWAGYKPDVGVVYEGEVDDPDIARSVENGRLEVSPLVSRELEALEGDVADKYRERGYDVDKADYVATEINRWRDLATVVDGAAPSNEITVGENPMKAEALHETVEETKAEALKEVSGVEFTGTADGKLDESEIEDNFGDHALYGSGENKEDYSYWVVDAEGNLRKGNVESAWQLGCRGQCPSDDTHDERVSALAEEFDNPPIDMDSESMGTGITDPANWEACNVELPADITQSDDGENGSSPQSSVADTSEETMSDDTDLTETEEAILEAADSVDEPVEALEEYAATEGPTIVAQDNYDSLQDQVSEIEGFMREALSERTDLKDETLEALNFEALRAEFENEDGEFDAEALVQNPETGEPDSDKSGAEALSDDADVDKAESLYADMQQFGVDHEDTIVEALGVEDFDAAIEVLN